MFWSTVFVSRRSRFSIEATRLEFSANSALRPKGLSSKISFRIVTLKMRNSLLFALLGAIYVAVEGHLFTYDDDQPVGRDRSYYSPSYYVSRTPPGLGRSHGHGSGHRGQYYPSYYVSRSLPRWPMRPHGQGPIYDYAPSPLGRSIYRDSRSKKKSQGRPIKGGWWYKWTKKGLISGRWGAPPPPGLEKEHYIYGGGNGGGWGWGNGGWGQSYHSQGGGWGGGHGGGHGGHGSHGPWGGKPSFHKHSQGPIHHSHGGPHKQHGHGGGYGSGGGWGWDNQGWD